MDAFKKVKIFAWSLFFCGFAASIFAAEKSPFKKLAKFENQGTQVSALVVRLDTGAVLAQLNPTKRLSPASTSKLVLASAALEKFGDMETFSSQIYLRGKLKDGVVEGDLVFYGVGDPSLTNEKLWFLTTDVARYGIRKVTGRIVVNNSYFGSIESGKERGSAKKSSHNAYDAPLSSAAVNFSVLAIVVTPSEKVGASAQLSIEPYPLGSAKIFGQVLTTRPGVPEHLSVSRISLNGEDAFTVSGNISSNSVAKRVYRSVSDANRYAGEVVNAFLKAAKVNTRDEVVVENEPLRASDQLIAQVEGYPVAWQLRGLLEMSNNFIADTFALQLLKAEKGDPSETHLNLNQAGSLLQNYMRNLLPAGQSALSASSGPLVMASGSGLTPENRLSAQDLVVLLEKMYSNSRLFPSFLAALPIPGEEGSLKKRFDSPSEIHLKQSLRAKTGTLTQPVSVVSLAGYDRLHDGSWVAFAVIANGSSKNSEVSIVSLRDSIDFDLADILTEK